MVKKFLRRKKGENKERRGILILAKGILILASGLICLLLLKGNLRLVGSAMVMILAMSWLIFCVSYKMKTKKKPNQKIIGKIFSLLQAPASFIKLAGSS